MDIEFNNVKELYDRLRPALNSKVNELKRFDIIVINNGREMLIKRLIGLPGETIEYQDNQLLVDGKEVEDIYGNGDTENFQITVPDGEYFVLGDNRENSMDSRVFGSFTKKEILGKTKYVIFPFGRFGDQDKR